MPSLRQHLDTLSRAALSKDTWKTLANYTGLGRGRSIQPISNPEALAAFLRSRSSHVAQTALYGYLKTRAGTRFPEMFENPDLLLAMNMAKWQIWLACLSDLTIYMGGLIQRRTQLENAHISRLLGMVVDAIMEETGLPADAPQEFPDTVERLKTRVANSDYSSVSDDEFAFSQSPDALFRWAPVADELKNRDRLIVKNSVRFRWQEVRRSARKLLEAEKLATFSTAGDTESTTTTSLPNGGRKTDAGGTSSLPP